MLSSIFSLSKFSVKDKILSITIKTMCYKGYKQLLILHSKLHFAVFKVIKSLTETMQGV